MFNGAYSQAMDRLSKKPTNSLSIEEASYKERPVPFYNWLNLCDGLSQL